MSMSKRLDGRHSDVMTSNEVDENEETNQLEAPLILSNRRSKSDQKIKSKSDGNIGDKVKYGSLADIQFVGAVRGLTASEVS